LTQIGMRPQDAPEETPSPLPAEERGSKPWDVTPAPPAEEPFSFEEPAAPPPDYSLVRSLLTEPVPAGMGEVLVTDLWARPEPPTRGRRPQAGDLERLRELFGDLWGRPGPGERGSGEATGAQEQTGAWEAARAREPAGAVARAREETGAWEAARGREAVEAAEVAAAPERGRAHDELPPADRSRAWERRQARWGEEPERKVEPPVDRQKAWEQRQELRELGLLRERPMSMLDARVEHYWGQVKEAREKAPQALVDPYTELVASFADVDLMETAEHRRNVGEYGQESDSLLKLGRAYVVIGRAKGARGAFRAAVKADPSHGAAWWHLGVASLLTRANQEAARALAEAADLWPGDFRAEMPLGVARYHLRDYAAAAEHFRRQAGGNKERLGARSFLACSLRMQEKWEDARIELNFLRQSGSAEWAGVAQQCLDCVERGEQKREGPLRARRRTKQMWRALLAAGGGGLWFAYAKAENLFREQAPWAAIPLFLAVLLLGRGLRGMSGRELPGEFGNAEQGLPCWQATTWMRPKRSEF